MIEDNRTKKEIVRIGAHLHEMVTIWDSAGNLLHKVLTPLKLEFRFKDVVQVIVGATILAIPIAFTREVWELGSELGNINIILIALLSITFICLFVYHNFYHDHIKTHLTEFLKRVISIYVLSFIVVGIILFLIDQASFDANLVISLKKIVIVTFPASMSAAVTDMIK